MANNFRDDPDYLSYATEVEHRSLQLNRALIEEKLEQLRLLRLDREVILGRVRVRKQRTEAKTSKESTR